MATLSITSSATFLRSSLVGEVNQYGWALRSPGAKRMDVGVVVEGGEGEGVSCQQPLWVNRLTFQMGWTGRSFSSPALFSGRTQRSATQTTTIH